MRASEFPVLERVAGTIFRYNMLRAGNRVGVAVSGGADSVCLLHVLRLVAPSHPLTVLHVNHCLRGAQSDADQRFVEDLARSLGLPAITERVNIRALGGNLEEAGRDARRSFFRRLIRNGDVDRVATAHTRDDQAETVLHRLLRGSGIRGLRGIRPVTEDGIVRPLIEVERKEVVAWLHDSGLPWREDATNADLRFTRNRIRRELLPELQRYNPQLRSVLANTAQLAEAEEHYWNEIVARTAAELFARGPRSVTMQAAQVAALPLALARRVVRAAAAEASGERHGLDFHHTEAALDLCRSPRGEGTVHLPGVTVSRSMDWVRFARTAEPPAGYSYEISVPGCVQATEGVTIRVELDAISADYNKTGAVCDAAKLPPRLIVRNWLAGDRLETHSGRFRKLKDLFQHARIPAWDREGWPVVTDGDTVIWTRQFGTAASFRPGDGTEAIVTFSQHPSEHTARGESNTGRSASNLSDTLRL